MKHEILKRALKGDRFEDLHIIDSHCHMGPWYNYYFPQAGPEEMLQDAKLVGIERLCIAPHASISCDYRLGNRLAAEAVSRYPDKLWALLVLNPHKPEEMDEEFKNYYSTPNFIGVKIHPVLHSDSVDGEGYRKVYERIRRFGGYILSHSWESGGSTCSVAQFETIVKEYPDIPFVLAHSGGTAEGVQKSIRLVNRYENAYMDTSGFELSNTWIQEVMEKVDPKKVLFGSDCPFHDIRGGVSRILFSNLEDEVKLAILRDNFNKLVQKHPKQYNT